MQYINLLNYSIEFYQCLIISNSVLALCSLTLTGFSHLLKTKTTITLALWARLISLYASGLITTVLLGTYAHSAVQFAFHKYAAYGVFWLFTLVLANRAVLQQYPRLSEVVWANMLIAGMLLMFKLQLVTTNIPAGPQGLCWILYSLFYLCAVLNFLFGSHYARQCVAGLGNRLCWIDPYVAPVNYEDFAIRNTCALCFCLLNLCCFVIVGHPIFSIAGVLLLLQFCVTLGLALRFSALCPNATLEHGFVIVTYRSLGASIATARIQLSRAFLPAFNPWLFAVVLLSGLTHSNVAYCTTDANDCEIASPVSEGAARSRGASLVGEAYNRGAQWASENPQTATYVTGVASGVTGTVVGEAIRQQFMLPDPATAQLTATTNELREETGALAERVDNADIYRAAYDRSQEQNAQLAEELQAKEKELQAKEKELQAKDQKIDELKAAANRPFWSRWLCFSKPRTND